MTQLKVEGEQVYFVKGEFLFIHDTLRPGRVMQRFSVASFGGYGSAYSRVGDKLYSYRANSWHQDKRNRVQNDLVYFTDLKSSNVEVKMTELA